MNPNSADDIRFDRLVDGELSPGEYRQLLSTLDDEPGGWRRCAQAFLEAQAWQKDLGGLRHEAEPLPQPTLVAKRNWLHIAGPLLAMAACFVVAFGLGAFITGPLPPSLTGGQGAVATNNSNPAPAPAPNAPGARPELAVAPKTAPPSPAGRTPAGHVTLVVRGANGQAQELEVPVYSQGEGMALANEPPAVPPEVLAALERMGHSVRRQQQMVPVNLQDGRRLVVPVEQLEIVPVGGPAYQ